MAGSLTRALVARHGAGRTDTSLRKCRLGGAGRFSTDLDFAAPADDTVLAVCEAIDGAAVAGFRYSVATTRGDGRHRSLTVEHGDLGRPAIGASVEFARRPLMLPAAVLSFVPLPVHRFYQIELPSIPVIAETEACAEKLARYRRTALGRDVYDLAQFAGRSLDERLIRRIWILKTWGDVVDDRRGLRPVDPMDVLVQHRPPTQQARQAMTSTNAKHCQIDPKMCSMQPEVCAPAPSAAAPPPRSPADRGTPRTAPSARSRSGRGSAADERDSRRILRLTCGNARRPGSPGAADCAVPAADRSLKAKIRALTSRTSRQDLRSALIRLGQILRGWASYFKLTRKLM